MVALLRVAFHATASVDQNLSEPALRVLVALFGGDVQPVHALLHVLLRTSLVVNLRHYEYGIHDAFFGSLPNAAQTLFRLVAVFGELQVRHSEFEVGKMVTSLRTLLEPFQSLLRVLLHAHALHEAFCHVGHRHLFALVGGGAESLVSRFGVLRCADALDEAVSEVVVCRQTACMRSVAVHFKSMRFVLAHAASGFVAACQVAFGLEASHLLRFAEATDSSGIVVALDGVERLADESVGIQFAFVLVFYAGCQGQSCQFVHFFVSLGFGSLAGSLCDGVGLAHGVDGGRTLGCCVFFLLEEIKNSHGLWYVSE